MADLGAGSGILSILIGGKNPKNIVYALEIQEQLANMAQRSVEMNGLANVICDPGRFKRSAPPACPGATLLVCNPPYERMGSGRASPNESHQDRPARGQMYV